MGQIPHEQVYGIILIMFISYIQGFGLAAKKNSQGLVTLKLMETPSTIFFKNMLN